jgi:uncharacterized protein (DUF1800 family)
MLTAAAAIAANRFGLGARPGDAEAIGSDPRGWLASQLEAPRRARSPAPQPASAAVLEEVRELRLARAIGARVRAAAEAPPGARPGSAPSGAAPQAAEPAAPADPAAPAIDAAALREFGAVVRGHYTDQVAARYRRAIGTDRPFVERLVHFWSSHFAVSADKQPLGAIAGLYEQEAIRPHVTGNFLELLRAAERHPAMILYLDNQLSMGEQSTAATLARRRRGRALGLNENLAREILELHTLGVAGGYTQHDVTELAKVLTGWTIGGALGRDGSPGARFGGEPGEPGQFHFRPVLHEPGAKEILGSRYAERGVEEGEAVLAALALHPATARHLAVKLARHFGADEPPAALVERLAQTYLRNDGELVPVYEALIGADEIWSTPLAKYKTPHELVISTYRALDYTPEDLQPLLAVLTQLGQRPFTPGSPAGWPDIAAAWDGADALLKRVEWAAGVGRATGTRVNPDALAAAVLGASAAQHTYSAIRRAESGSQGLALLFAAPEFQRR